ncbi:hypothetical protein MWU77_03550 [Rhodococcus sp. F64268]|uniref:hypothetical protein n=1 Tax=Rhodococcus sp. F64268 TaxID=2926402 RepID=UPI001FF338BE|nr:hypothetical protein [Rhodococcus sp. F64268]MCK0089854.1 hypothetical protein [Rhodococcus sp. F64268]
MTVDPATELPDVPALPPEPRRGIVALLVFDGALCAILSVLFLGLYIGPVPFPITILLAAVINLLLVMAVYSETDSLRTAMLPLAAWLLGFAVCLAVGPGGDQLAMADWRILMLPVAALLPAGGYLFSARIKAIIKTARPPAQQM